MRRLRNLIPLLIVLVLTGGLVLALEVTAQTDDCPALVQQALVDVGNNCADLSRNSACYGFNRVDATFFEAVADDFFTQPSDRAELITMQSIETAPLDVTLNEWGVALLSVQANVPDTLPGQAVTFVLLGDTTLENQVPPDEARTPTEPVIVRATVGANIRSSPTTAANVIGGAPAGTELAADAISADGGWVRVIVNERTPGWISLQVVEPQGDISTLPVANEESPSPMQAFYLRTGIGEPECKEAPSLLVVQGPQRFQVNLNLNGVDVSLGSTIVLQQTDEDTLKLMVVDGKAETGDLEIDAGFAVEASLDENGTVEDNFDGRRPLTRDELESLETLEDLPGDLLNYPIDVPAGPAQVRPTITPGGPTFTPRPTGTPGTVTPGSPGVDCSRFQATSPREGLAYDFNTFFWDPAPGATSYRVNVIGYTLVEVPAPNTSATIDLTTFGTVYEMTYTVDALLNGVVACSTPPLTLPREANPPPPFVANWGCTSDGQFAVNYSSVPRGSTSIVINFNVAAGAPIDPPPGVTIGVPPDAGSVTFTGVNRVYVDSGSITALPSGVTIPIQSGQLGC